MDIQTGIGSALLVLGVFAVALSLRDIVFACTSALAPGSRSGARGGDRVRRREQPLSGDGLLCLSSRQGRNA
ncbi:hypothetical protein LP419_17290 [Massilia sp. H-1]|nr:hypothetical protein LP419_17290 [Massilia sp. H-1]